MPTLAARIRAGSETWHFDDTEWWILRRHWAIAGPQGGAMGRLFGTGGSLTREELALLERFFDSFTEQRQKPLVVGSDKYPSISNWHQRWRALLQASGVAFESHSSTGVAVFRRKVNLTRRNPGARPDLHDALPPFHAAFTKLNEVLVQARRAGGLEVWLATTYEGF